MKSIKSLDTKKLVLLALLTAIVIVLQVFSSIVPVFPFRLNLVLVPIVIGAALITPLAGAWLGFIFGLTVLISSPDVIPFMIFNPPATIIVILLRGIFAGFAAGFVYNALTIRINKTIAVLAAAVVCAVTNTALFVIGIYIFFLPILEEWGVTGASNVASFIFLSMIGFNFFFELLINLIFSPSIVRLIQYKQKYKDNIE